MPLLISLPHVGTDIPPALADRLVPRALASEDTDWHLARLYRPLAERLGRQPHRWRATAATSST